VFAAWPPDVVLANHAMMQPHVVKRALTGAALTGTVPAGLPPAGTSPAGAAPYVVTVHGSELNFSVKRDPRLVPYATNGLDDAAAIVTNSGTSAEDVVLWARAHGLDIAEKTRVVPPGINAETFAPAASRAAAIDAVRREVALPAGFDLQPDDDVLAFAGRLMWTKGIQHAVAALPLIARQRPCARLLVAGDGPARAPLERLAARLSEGDAAGARGLVNAEQELRTLPEFGPVVVEPVVPESAEHAGELRVAFLGHLTPAQLALVFAAADVSLAPSIFPESLGLVTMEALSAGALPIAGYHSGLMSVLDVVSDSLDDPAFRSLPPGASLTAGIARLVVDVLERYPTADPMFRARLHDLSAQHFPTWEKVARRYLELAAGARPSPP
jgi:glycosyltransferase involved in cell wall biosynthesis